MNGNCQAYDDVGGNYWYDNTTKEGNYWSNWDGNGWGTPNAYPIDGGAGACDMYPLSQPWTGVATLSERCSGEGFGCGDWQCSEQLVYGGNVNKYGEKAGSISFLTTLRCESRLISCKKKFNTAEMNEIFINKATIKQSR